MEPNQGADTYSKFATYYDAYVGEFNPDIPVYLHFAEDAAHILEIGCGTGRVLKPLLEKGYRVTGVDISPAMLNVAGQKLSPYIISGQLDLVEHNLCRSALQCMYDRIFITFYTFNYLLDSVDSDNFVRNVFRMLTRDGLLVADLFYPSALSNPGQAGRWKSRTFTMKGRKITLMDKRKLSGDIEIRIQRYIEGDTVDEIVSERRFFDKSSIEKLLSEAGFNNIRFADGYTISGLHELNPGEKATGSYVVSAEKRK